MVDGNVAFRGPGETSWEAFQLAAESQLPKGKRGWLRSRRPSQPADPGVQKVAQWQVHGPLGNSREDTTNGIGLLSVDYTEGVDTIYDQLALPGPKFNPIDLVSISQSEYVETSDLGSETDVVDNGANDASVGANAWTDPENIVGDGSDYASVSAVGNSNYLLGTFDARTRVPAGAHPVGFVGTVKRSQFGPSLAGAFESLSAVASGSGTTSATCTVTPPSGVTVGDMLVAFVWGVGNEGFGSPTIPTFTALGWIQRATVTTSFGPDNTYRYSLYTRPATGSDPYQFDASGAGNSSTGIIARVARLSGCATSPIVATISPTTSFITSIPSITTQEDASFVLCGVLGTQSSATTPSGTSLISDLNGLSLFSYTQATAGATGSKATTVTGTGGSPFSRFQIAFAPSTVDANVQDNDVRLWIDGGFDGDNMSVAGEWPATPTEQRYGSPYNTWGVPSVTESEANGVLGIGVSATLNDGEARAYHMSLETYYTETQILPVYTAEVGAFPVGAAPVGGGSASSVPQTVRFIDEDRGQLFFHGGAYSTQVDPATMTTVDAVVHNAAVRGAADWRNRGYLGLGSTTPMQRRVAVTTIGSTYEDVSLTSPSASAYAGPVVTGSDRFWWVDVTDPDNVLLTYSFDALVNAAAPFPVGDPGIGATGLGTYGRSAVMGQSTGAYGFTTLGIPVRVLESIKGQNSPANSNDIITFWGWTYITTSMGLKATIPGQVENPAGLPRSFEGKPQGIPTAIWPYKDALFMAVQDIDGDTYILRGEFGPQTRETGQPLWYPFMVLTDEVVDALHSTAQRPTAGLKPSQTLLMGVGANAGYVILGRTERDIDDPDYRFETGALRWVGTTMMRDDNTLKNIRYLNALVQGVSDGASVQFLVSVDEGDFIPLGEAVTTSGAKFIRPAFNGVPQTNVHGNTFKLAFDLLNVSETVPVKVRGTVDMTYDERPDTIVEHMFVFLIDSSLRTNQTAMQIFERLESGDLAYSPMTFKYPAPYPPDDHYGFVTAVTGAQDLKGDSVQTFTVTVQEWVAEGEEQS